MSRRAGRAKDAVHRSVATFLHRDFFSIPLDNTVAEAIARVRTTGQRGNIFYLYVVDETEKLRGIVSIRNLLVARDDQRIRDVYSSGIVSLPETAQVADAYKLFSESRFLSLPLVDAEGRLRGVVHAHELIEQYDKHTEELFEERTRGELFELLGIKAEDASLSINRIASGRLPWLLVNVLGGGLSAYFIHAFGSKLPHAVEFMAFLPILLIVSESIGMQTASVVIANINRGAGNKGAGNPAKKEMGVALILGLCCAILVAVSVHVAKGFATLSIAVGLTILLGALYVSGLGTAIPYLIHRMHGDPRIAAGPVVLATADCGTLLLYLLISLWLTHM